MSKVRWLEDLRCACDVVYPNCGMCPCLELCQKCKVRK